MNRKVPSASEQSLEYIRRSYGVPARTGKHVEYKGKRGIVAGGQNAHVMVKLEEDKHARPYHPSDLDWLEPKEQR